MVVGSPYYSSQGAAYVFYGSNQGIVINNPKILQSNQPDAKMGTSVSSAGDVNGDGFADIIVGTPGYDKNQSDEGVAIVYYGTQNGITEVSPAPTQLGQSVPNGGFGVSVKTAGDVNGDG